MGNHLHTPRHEPLLLVAIMELAETVFVRERVRERERERERERGGERQEGSAIEKDETVSERAKE